MSNNTQLSSASGFNVSNIVFNEPTQNAIPNSKLSYYRIPIQMRYADGCVGDLVLSTGRLFSFGVSENRSMDTNKVNGYVLPICLWNKDGPSGEEKEWTDTFNNIVEACKEHLLSAKHDVGKYDLESSDLKKFNPLYWKRDRNGIVPNTGPTLYAKLIRSMKNGVEKIKSNFYDANSDDEIGPLSLMGKYCYVQAAIKFESIFVGNKCSLQVKLYEAYVELLDAGPKRLLKPSNKVNGFSGSGFRSAPVQATALAESSEEELVYVSEDDEEEEMKKPSPARRGRRKK